MKIEFDTLKVGEVLFDVHRQKMGNTTMSQLGWWTVKVVSLHPSDDPKTPWNWHAMCSWNGNAPRLYTRSMLQRLRRKLPKSLDPEGKRTAFYRVEKS